MSAKVLDNAVEQPRARRRTDKGGKANAFQIMKEQFLAAPAEIISYLVTYCMKNLGVSIRDNSFVVIPRGIKDLTFRETVSGLLTALGFTETIFGEHVGLKCPEAVASEFIRFISSSEELRPYRGVADSSSGSSGAEATRSVSSAATNTKGLIQATPLMNRQRSASDAPTSRHLGVAPMGGIENLPPAPTPGPTPRMGVSSSLTAKPELGALSALRATSANIAASGFHRSQRGSVATTGTSANSSTSSAGPDIRAELGSDQTPSVTKGLFAQLENTGSKTRSASITASSSSLLSSSSHPKGAFASITSFTRNANLPKSTSLTAQCECSSGPLSLIEPSSLQAQGFPLRRTMSEDFGFEAETPTPLSFESSSPLLSPSIVDSRSSSTNPVDTAGSSQTSALRSFSFDGADLRSVPASAMQRAGLAPLLVPSAINISLGPCSSGSSQGSSGSLVAESPTYSSLIAGVSDMRVNEQRALGQNEHTDSGADFGGSSTVTGAASSSGLLGLGKKPSTFSRRKRPNIMEPVLEVSETSAESKDGNSMEMPPPITLRRSPRTISSSDQAQPKVLLTSTSKSDLTKGSPKDANSRKRGSPSNAEVAVEPQSTSTFSYEKVVAAANQPTIVGGDIAAGSASGTRSSAPTVSFSGEPMVTEPNMITSAAASTTHPTTVSSSESIYETICAVAKSALPAFASLVSSSVAMSGFSGGNVACSPVAQEASMESTRKLVSPQQTVHPPKTGGFSLDQGESMHRCFSPRTLQEKMSASYDEEVEEDRLRAISLDSSRGGLDNVSSRVFNNEKWDRERERDRDLEDCSRRRQQRAFRRTQTDPPIPQSCALQNGMFPGGNRGPTENEATTAMNSRQSIESPSSGGGFGFSMSQPTTSSGSGIHNSLLDEPMMAAPAGNTMCTPQPVEVQSVGNRFAFMTTTGAPTAALRPLRTKLWSEMSKRDALRGGRCSSGSSNGSHGLSIGSCLDLEGGPGKSPGQGSSGHLMPCSDMTANDLIQNMKRPPPVQRISRSQTIGSMLESQNTNRARGSLSVRESRDESRQLGAARSLFSDIPSSQSSGRPSLTRTMSMFPDDEIGSWPAVQASTSTVRMETDLPADATRAKKDKARRDKAKLRRLSVSLRVDAAENSISPHVQAKVRSSSWRRDRRHSAILSPVASDSIEHEDYVVVGHSPDDCNDMPDQAPLCTEMNFKSVIVGGRYQHSFDGIMPVVAAPQSSDKRVTAVNIVEDDGSLIIKIYVPSLGTHRIVQLCVGWQHSRVSPSGFLVWSPNSDISLHYSKLPPVSYYLPMHPIEFSNISPDFRAEAALAVSSLHESCSPDRIQSALLRGMSSDIDGSHHQMAYLQYHGTDLSALPLNESGTHSMVDGDLNESAIHMDISGCDDHYHGCLTQMALHSDDSGTYSIPGVTESSPLGRSELCRVSSFDNICAVDVDVVYPDDVLAIDGSLASNEERMQSAVLSSRSVDWNDRDIIGCVLRFLCDADQRLPGNEDQVETTVVSWYDARLVCKTWALTVASIEAERLSSRSNGGQLLSQSQWRKFLQLYPVGRYLGDGACKRVFAVYSQPSQRCEAVSVMDMRDLVDRGMETMLAQELSVSLVASSLVKYNICPNLVQIFSVFQSPFDVPQSAWSQRAGVDLATCKVALPKKFTGAGEFQYCRMELCSNGDVESMLRKSSNLTLLDMRCLLFQMSFSLYCSRDQFSLRHFDLKLLNFFSSNANVLLYASSQSAVDTAIVPVDMVVAFGSNRYRLPLHSGSLEATTPSLAQLARSGRSGIGVIKLADFGTSFQGSQALGDPITVQQFSTLENTPPEYLMLGSVTRQSFAADTFALGLVWVHVLTESRMPYEEMMSDVTCPEFLFERLRDLWERQRLPVGISNTGAVKSRDYRIIKEVIDSLDDGDDYPTSVSSGNPRRVLYDTLYRYVVMIGFDPNVHNLFESNPVFKVLIDALFEPVAQGFTSRKRSELDDKKRHCQDCFKRDQRLWSYREGTHKYMKMLRKNLAELGQDAEHILRRMLTFDHANRATMYEIIVSDVMKPLIDSSGQYWSSNPHEKCFNYYGSLPNDALPIV